jgi:hypothetical protein
MQRLFGWATMTSGSLVLASSWIFVMPSAGARWDIRVTGAIIVIAAVAATRLRPAWGSGAAVIEMFTGIWLLLSTTFVNGDYVAVWTNMVLGIATTFVAALEYDRLTSSGKAAA